MGSPLGSPVGTSDSVRVGLGAWRAHMAIRVIAQHTPVVRQCVESLSRQNDLFEGSVTVG